MPEEFSPRIPTFMLPRMASAFITLPKPSDTSSMGATISLLETRNSLLTDSTTLDPSLSPTKSTATSGTIRAGSLSQLHHAGQLPAM